MKSRRQFLLVAVALLCGVSSRVAVADGTVVSVSAFVVSKSNCKFRTTSSAALPFGTLDASLSSDKVVSATLDFRCQGSAPIAYYVFSSDDGLNEAGPNRPRMRHATESNEYLPYSLGLSPASGSIAKGATGTLTLTGTVTPADVAGAVAGAFSDTVTLTLQP